MTINTDRVNSEWFDERLTINAKPIENYPKPENLRLSGWLYVLENKYMPGILKIGMTTNEPEFRANQISQGTGIPHPFNVCAAYYSDDPKGDEAEIHELLECSRISNNREFFDCSLSEINAAMESIGLLNRKAEMDEIADNYNLICLEESRHFSIDEVLEDLDIRVFGCKFAAVKRLIELAASNVKKLSASGHSLLIHEAQATPILTYVGKLEREETRKINEAGAYGPKKPWRI